MQWIEAKVIFDCDDASPATDLIANIFYDFGVQGVVIEEPFFEPLEGWENSPPSMPEYYAVSGYFPNNKQSEEKCKVLEEQLVKLKKESRIISKITYKEIDEEDWAESWKEYFWPEKIGRRIVVKPTWREYSPQKDEVILEIDPGMAFGTGTHPTTSLCIELIEKHLKKGASCLDIGTGSGILMIAAAMLGAGKVWGIDIDADAVKIARKNILQNRIAQKKFMVQTGDLVNEVKETFDLVVANISLERIIALLDTVTRILPEDGMFICSGFLENNKNTIAKQMESLGFERIEVLTKQNWAAIAGRI